MEGVQLRKKQLEMAERKKQAARRLASKDNHTNQDAIPVSDLPANSTILCIYTHSSYNSLTHVSICGNIHTPVALILMYIYILKTYKVEKGKGPTMTVQETTNEHQKTTDHTDARSSISHRSVLKDAAKVSALKSARRIWYGVTLSFLMFLERVTF